MSSRRLSRPRLSQIFSSVRVKGRLFLSVTDLPALAPGGKALDRSFGSGGDMSVRSAGCERQLESTRTVTGGGQVQQELQRELAVARAKPLSLKDLKSPRRPAIFHSSQSVNREVPASDAAEFRVGEDPLGDCHSLSESQCSSSSDLHRPGVGQLSGGGSESALFTVRPCRQGGSRRSQLLQDPQDHSRKLQRYRELKQLLAELRAQKAQKELELRKLTQREAELSSSRQPTDATDADGGKKCLPTQFMVAVDSGKGSDAESALSADLQQLEQEIAVQRVVVEAQTRLLREAKESKQSKQLRKQRLAEYQQALDKLQQQNMRAQSLRQKMSRDSGASDTTSQLAVAGDFGDDSSSLVYSSPRQVDSAQHTGQLKPSLSTQFYESSALSDTASREPSIRSLAPPSVINRRLDTQHAAAGSDSWRDRYSPAPLHLQQQQQQQQQDHHRVTQCSLDSGFQEASAVTSVSSLYKGEWSPRAAAEAAEATTPVAPRQRQAVAKAGALSRRSNSVGDLLAQQQYHEQYHQQQQAQYHCQPAYQQQQPAYQQQQPAYQQQQPAYQQQQPAYQQQQPAYQQQQPAYQRQAACRPLNTNFPTMAAPTPAGPYRRGSASSGGSGGQFRYQPRQRLEQLAAADWPAPSLSANEQSVYWYTPPAALEPQSPRQLQHAETSYL